MSNLDYELMLEECVEGTFFERGPSGFVKKNSEPTKNTTEEISERKKRRYEKIKKGLITGTFIVGGVAVTLGAHKAIKCAKNSREEKLKNEADSVEKEIINFAHEYNKAYKANNFDECESLWGKIMGSMNTYRGLVDKITTDYEAAYQKKMDIIKRTEDIALKKSL